MGGILLAIVSKDVLATTITSIAEAELSEDSKDVIATHLFHWGTQLSVSTKAIVVFYLLGHGVIKLSLLYGLWKNKLVVYPLAAGAFFLFSLYPVYRYAMNHSPWLLLVSLIDLIYVYLILYKYRLLKREKG